MVLLNIVKKNQEKSKIHLRKTEACNLIILLNFILFVFFLKGEKSFYIS